MTLPEDIGQRRAAAVRTAWWLAGAAAVVADDASEGWSCGHAVRSRIEEPTIAESTAIAVTDAIPSTIGRISERSSPKKTAIPVFFGRFFAEHQRRAEAPS